MPTVQFRTLSVGNTFTFDNKEYIRTVDQKVSCCSTLNAAEVAQPANKIMVKPNVLVEVTNNE